MNTTLRKRKPISYYEPEEPAFDDYMYCEECADFVYEYCSIHGALLVIPDDKVPTNAYTPSFVPRAALTIPRVFLHIAPSVIPGDPLATGAGLGVFSTLTLPRGVRFGPYRGKRTDEINSMYCWQLWNDSRKPCGVVDAQDASTSNWMRFVNCARHWREQNLLAYQYQGHIYYRTIKIIPRFTELMVFYGSEFANRLHIDLGKYNIPEQYANVISASYKTTKDLQTKPNVLVKSINFENEINCTENSISTNTITTHISLDTEFPSNDQLQETEDRINDITDSGINDVAINEIDSFNEDKSTESLFIREINNYSNESKAPETTPNNRLKVDYDLEKETFTVIFNQSEPAISDVPKKVINYSDCDVCGKRFTRKYSLNRHHKSTHLNRSNNFPIPTISDDSTKNYVNCDICGIRIPFDALITHKLSHSNVNINSFDQSEAKTNNDKPKNVNCDVCGKKVSKKGLRKHKFTHLVIKRFHCQNCDYKSNDRWTFNQHLNIHTKSILFKCSLCPYESYVRKNFATHFSGHKKRNSCVK